MTCAGLLTPRKAAAYLGICVRTLRKHVARGDLPYIHTGHGSVRRHRMFHPDDLAEFVRARRDRECLPIAAQESRTTSTISGSKVIDFTALHAAQISVTQTSSKRPKGKRPPSILRKLGR
ncbi:MAG: helix-turn-helix domain-containing protein [Methylobacterium sp.]|nr:helix-turn-helix domain-containing protein [Methylobacterium sp.]